MIPMQVCVSTLLHFGFVRKHVEQGEQGHPKHRTQNTMVSICMHKIKYGFF